MGISQTPGSNAHEIIQNIEKLLEELKPSFPEGITYTINYNANTFLDAAISKVVSTLLEAFLLVFFGGVYFLARLPLYAYSCYCGASVYRRYFLLLEPLWLFYQYAHPLCLGIGYRYSGG